MRYGILQTFYHNLTTAGMFVGGGGAVTIFFTCIKPNYKKKKYFLFSRRISLFKLHFYIKFTSWTNKDEDGGSKQISLQPPWMTSFDLIIFLRKSSFHSKNQV